MKKRIATISTCGLLLLLLTAVFVLTICHASAQTGGNGVEPAERDCAMTSIGANETATTWYFAEGSTGMSEVGRFETWILLLNTGSGNASVNLLYYTPEGEVKGPSLTLAPGTRQSVDVSKTVQNTWSVGTKVSSDTGIAAQMSMYWNEY